MTTTSNALVINTVADDNIVNTIEKRNGVTVTGIANAFSVVFVAWGTSMHYCWAGPNGAWSSTFASAEIPADGDSGITAIAIDRASTGSVSSRVVKLDTVVGAPVINTVAADNIINAIEKHNGVTVTGIAEAGSVVHVKWGNTEQIVQAGTNGAWSSTFASSKIPDDGDSAITAIAMDRAGNVSTVSSHAVTLDTLMGEPLFYTVANDNRINAIEKHNGVTVTGIAEAGSEVHVRWGNAEHFVRVDTDGGWSSTFASAEIPVDGDSAITAFAVDRAGNVSKGNSQTVTIDTLGGRGPIINTVAGDNIINAIEKHNGVTVTGIAENSCDVDVKWGNTEHYVRADANGEWSSTFASAEIPADGDSAITAVLIDRAGNVSTASSHAVKVDTVMEAPAINTVAGDNIINAIEKLNGVTVTGIAEAGSVVHVKWGNTEQIVQAGTNGAWSSTFASDKIPDDGDSAITLIARDTAGNVSVNFHAVTLDTLVGEPLFYTVANDNRINAIEKYNGVTVTGIVEAGSEVHVKWGNAEHFVRADTDGGWSSTFAGAEIPADGHSAITAFAVDRAGNVSKGNSQIVTIDTVGGAGPIINYVALDDKVNAIDKHNGVTVTGIAENSCDVDVRWGNTEHYVRADANGEWSSTFASAEIPADGDSAITAFLIDRAGNFSTVSSHAVKVDTVVEAPVINTVAGDNIINAIEKHNGVVVTGIAEAGSYVHVRWGNIEQVVMAANSGQWWSTFASAEIPADGDSVITATARDRAYNDSTVSSHAVKVDTAVALGAHNMVNAAQSSWATSNIIPEQFHSNAGVVISG